MKTFFKDYVELQRHSNEWVKEHWVGYTLLTVGVSVCYFGGVYLWLAKEGKKRKLKTENSVTVEEA